MAKPPRWKQTLTASRSEVALAVTLYNDPLQPRSFEGFVVHMHLAWLYLLHAQFERDKVDFRYRDSENPRLLVKIDGEAKRWELAKCIKHRWQSNEPVRKNLEFFIALRNKIEHRHTTFDDSLALAVSGKAQALLLNFEEEMTSCFGREWSMASVLRFPVFVGTFTEEGSATIKTLRDKLPTHLKKFIAEYNSGVPDEIQDDPRFEVRLNVILQKVNRGSDALAMEFISWDDLSDEEQVAYEILSRRGLTVTRERARPIVNHGMYLPTHARERIEMAIPFVFTMHDFVCAYRNQGIRPENGSEYPERTNETYCAYDSLHKSYSYHEAWVNRAIRKCQTEEGFCEFVGRPARPKLPPPADRRPDPDPARAAHGDHTTSLDSGPLMPPV